MRVVQARLAEPADLDAVVPVLRSVRAESPLGAQLVNPDADLDGHLRAWYALPNAYMVLAEADDQVVGVALAQVIEANLFSDVAYLQMEALYVQTAFRRRGAGRALMGQLGLVGARAGAEQVVTMPISGSRSEQRFLSGLGFTVVGARRMTPTAALLRRMEQQAKGRERRGRGIDELIARRRRSRGLPPTPPAGVSLSELADRAEDLLADGARSRE
ncbi:N-acetyltransferase family protein [Pseudactinotalea sp. Z1748]|uniref:GNAT family N-acetyltransferase n=1 Tax=Pseudactinotalea sp. Z1748 TaxID=3413027 RepID=UPI003C7C93FD